MDLLNQNAHHDRRVGFAPVRSLSVMATGVMLCMLLFSGCHSGSTRKRSTITESGIRAIWVTRWDYKSPRDIRKIMDNCLDAGFNTILFQVRGNGTVFYRSRIEPWADELGGRDPGFDPLAVACRAAHRRGLNLHAWANVMPGWRGKKPPAHPRQLYHAHPEWFLRDSTGRRQPLGWYDSLNPCYPEVRQYLVSVMREIVAHYPIDGLHLDYMRFPNEWNPSYPQGAKVPDYPRDPRTLSLFRRATGKTPEQSPALWDRWRSEQVTRVVQDIREVVRDIKPDVELSVAAGADPQQAKHLHYQDVRRWLAMGLLDAVYPMNYSENMRSYDGRLAAWAAMHLRIPVVTGVMFDKRGVQTVLEQLRRARRSSLHFSAFAYHSLFERLDEHGHRIRDPQSRQRAALRKHVVPFIRKLASARTSNAA